MVQSDVPRSTTRSGKVNTKWYLQRLRTSAISRQNYLENDVQPNKTIRIGRGTTETQRKYIQHVHLHSASKSIESEQKRKVADEKCSSPSKIRSAKSLKSASTTNKLSTSASELNSTSYQSLATTVNPRDEKDNLSDRRSSCGTILSVKPDLIVRPPSTPVDPRCHRAYSAVTDHIHREACSLLGPKLCADCIEVQTRANLSAERLPPNIISQRLSALAIRRFLKNQENLTDDDLLKLINNQQIQMNKKISSETISSIISEDQYFDRLSVSLNQCASETPYYFKNLKDFSRKYRSNKYQRLLLSETPPPKSANPVFKEGSFEKFDISPKYSSMKKASMVKYDLKSKGLAFISTRKSEQFHRQHPNLLNYSPPLLLQSSQQSLRNNSNPNILTCSQLNFSSSRKEKRSLIASKLHYLQTVDS